MVTNVFVASGKQVKENINKPEISSNVFIRLDDGQHVRIVFFPNEEDLFQQYYSHSDFKKKIFSHPCLINDCPSCDAGIKRTTKILVPVYDLDADEIRIIDASARQLSNICQILDEYADEPGLAFKYSRTGKQLDTVYSLTPIFPSKLSKEDRAKIAKVPELRKQVTEEFLLQALRPKTKEQILEMLNKGQTQTEDENIEPMGDEDLPF